MDKKKYIDILNSQATADGVPHELALANFLDYLLQFFSIEAYSGGFDGYARHVQTVAQEKPDFAALALVWLGDVADAMEHGRWLDAFGELYEEMYLSRGKASHTGQFFTPPSVSDLMSRIIDNGKNEGNVNDCAAGSGRLLLAHYIERTKENHAAGRRFKYIAQDSDPMAAKMCALNLMAHGMYGRVECRDSLRWNTPTAVYYINEVRYPISTPYYSIRIENPGK